MSYDLFLRPRVGSVDADTFAKYFEGRTNFIVKDDEASYENLHTGVYFTFDFSEELEDGDEEELDDELGEFPIVFNMNYGRPSFFGLEAEIELSAFVNHFNLVVLDPELDELVKEFDPNEFLNEWNKGNELAYKLTMEDAIDVTSLAASKLVASWRWNYSRQKKQGQLGEEFFVPVIMFLALEGEIATACVWPDAIQTLVPPVDYIVIHREKLAPKKFLFKKPDMALLEYANLEPVLENLNVGSDLGGYLLKYDPIQFVERVYQRIACF